MPYTPMSEAIDFALIILEKNKNILESLYKTQLNSNPESGLSFIAENDAKKVFLVIEPDFKNRNPILPSGKAYHMQGGHKNLAEIFNKSNPEAWKGFLRAEFVLDIRSTHSFNPNPLDKEEFERIFNKYLLRES